MYNYDVSTGVFSFNGTTTIMQPAYAAVWDEDIKAASINYDFSSGFARFFLLSLYQTVEVDISCKITVSTNISPKVSVIATKTYGRDQIWLL